MRALISGWIGSKNVGDELLLTAMIGLLRDAGVNDIAAISINPEETRRAHNIDAVSAHHFQDLRVAFKKADFFVLGPGGLLQDATSILSIPYHLCRILLARFYKIPVFVLGVGAGPLESPLSRLICRKTLAYAEKIIVRDEESKKLLQDIGVSRVDLAPDLVFTLPAAEMRADSVINVNYRPPLAKRFNLFGKASTIAKHETRTSSLARALDEVMDRTGVPMRFLSFEEGRDDVILKEVASKMRNAPREIVNVSIDDAIAQMAQGRLAIAARFHAGVCSVLANRPALMIGYSPKVVSLAKALHEPPFLVADDSEGFADIPDRACEMLDGGECALQEGAKIKAAANVWRTEIKSIVHSVRQAAN